MILVFLKHRTCVNAEHGELQAKSVMLRSFQHCPRGKPPVFTRGLLPVGVLGHGEMSLAG